MTGSVCMARSNERGLRALSFLAPTVCGSTWLGTRELALLVRMIVSSKFPQFRHRIVSIPVRDSSSVRSQNVSMTINPPHRSHDISLSS
jgi:hypothetical protein